MPVDFDPSTTPFTPVIDDALAGKLPAKPSAIDLAVAPVTTQTVPQVTTPPQTQGVDFDPTTTPFVPAPEPKKIVAFDPTKEAHEKIFSLADFKALPVDQLDREKQFEPTDFGFQHEDELNADPEAKAKLLEVYKLRNQPFHQTRQFLAQPAGDIAKQALLGAVHAPGKLIGGAWHVGTDIAKGVWNAAQRAGGAFLGLGVAGFDKLTGASPQQVNQDLAFAGTQGAELSAGLEAQSTSEAGLLGRGVRAAGETAAALDPTGIVKDLTGAKAFSELTPQELQTRFANDVAEKRAVQDATRGTGEMVRAIIGSEPELKEAGIQIDPAAVEKLMSATSLLNFIPLGEGLAVGAVGKVGGRFVVEKVAQAATKEQANLFIRAVNEGAELAGRATKAAGEGLETAGGNLREKIFKPLHNLGDVSAVLAGTGGHLGVGAGIAGVTKLTPKALELTGRGLQKAAPYGGTAARIAADSAIEGAKGYARGLLYTLPFMVGATPTEREGLLNVAALAGGVRGGVRAAGLTGQIVGFKAQEALARKIFEHVEQKEAPPVPDYGTDLNLDSQARVNEANLPKAQKNFLGWVKHAFKNSGVEFYLLTDAQFLQQTGGQGGRGFALKLGQTIAPDGSTKPLVRIFLNGDVEALPHEMLHALGNIDAPGYGDFVKAVNDSLTTHERQTFEQIYNTVQNGGLPESQWKTRLTPEKVNEEVAAEIFSRVILGQDLSGVKPTLARKAALFTSNLIEKLGVPLGDVNPVQAKDINPRANRPGFSTLGVRPTADATIISQNFIQGLLNHLQNNGDLLPNYTRPSLLKGGQVTGTSSLIKPRPRTPAPTPGPVAPAAPASPAGPAAPVAPSSGPTTPTPLPSGPSPAPKPRNIRTTEGAQNDFSAQRAKVTNTEKAAAAAEKGGDAETVKHVGEISKVLESGRGVVELEYHSVKDEGNANAPTTRTPRREAQEAAYIAEGMGAAPSDVRDLAQKVTVPVRWEVQGGKPQLIAMSLDKVIANISQTVKDATAQKVESKIPYETKDGNLTDAAWHEVVTDLQTYAENQSNGYRGDGQKLVRPKEDIGTSIPAENPAYNPGLLSEQKANFLNYIQALNPPLTAREVKGVTPGNVKGQIIAEINARKPEKPAVIRPQDIQKQTFKSGREIMETNPLRNELSAAGVDPRKLIEVTERIDPAMIAKVTPREDLNFMAPVTDTIRGGFLPGGKTLAEFGADILNDSAEEWTKRTQAMQGGLTSGAFRLGHGLTDAADVGVLKDLAKQAEKQYAEARAAGDLDKMFPAGFKRQFFNEALEAATGSAPSKKTAIGNVLGADWQPPFPEGPKPEGKFLPKTEAGVKLMDEGFDFRVAGQPGTRSITVLKDGVVVGEFQSAQRTANTAEISNVQLNKSQRGTGAAEAAYRELLTQLKADGVTKVEGTVVAPEPLAIRKKIFGGFDKLEINGEPVSIDEAIKASEKFKGPTREVVHIEATNEITPGVQFLPKIDEPRAVQSAAVRDKESGEIFAGPTHGAAMRKAAIAAGTPEKEFSLSTSYANPNLEQGFVTQGGDFLTREEALKRVEELGQIAPENLADASQYQNKKNLEAVGFEHHREFLPGKPRSDRQVKLDHRKKVFDTISEEVDRVQSEIDELRAADPEYKNGVNPQLKQLRKYISQLHDIESQFTKMTDTSAIHPPDFLSDLLNDDQGPFKSVRLFDGVARDENNPVLGQLYNEIRDYSNLLSDAVHSANEEAVPSGLGLLGAGPLKPRDAATFRRELMTRFGLDWPDASYVADRVFSDNGINSGMRNAASRVENQEVADKALAAFRKLNAGPNEIRMFIAGKTLRELAPRGAALPGGQNKQNELNGLAFKDFFSKVSKGEFGKSNIPWVPVTNIEKQKDLYQAVQEHSGNFDDHIAKSIPTYREAQLRKGTAIIALAGDGDLRVLDIGGSEGSWDKAVTQVSGGKVTTVTVDPNPAMSEFFHEKSEVPGATHVTAGFREGFDDNGVHIPAFDSTKKFDVVNESMTFQFINPNRKDQVEEVKRLLNPGGLFITDEKFRTQDWAKNEAKKDKDYKAVYFTNDELKAKDKVVGFQQAKQETKTVGMVDNMVTPEAYEQILRDNFKFVSQYWDAGNFRGYVASDDLPILQKFLREVGDNSSEFSTEKTPRAIPNVREQGENMLLTNQRLVAGQLMPQFPRPLSAEELAKALEKNKPMKLPEIKAKSETPKVEPLDFNPLDITGTNPLGLDIGDFLPKGKREKDKSPIVAAAVKLDNGTIIVAPTHFQAMEKALEQAPSYEGNFAEGFTTSAGEFLNRKQALARAEAIKQLPKGKGLAQMLGNLEATEFEKNRNFLPGSAGWILPNQKFVPLAASYHEQYLADKSKELNKKFGTTFGPEADVNERLKALNKGFVRIRGDINTGATSIELNAKFFRGPTRRAIENFLSDKADDIDVLKMSLLNDKGNPVDSTVARVFEFEGPERAKALLDAVDSLRPGVREEKDKGRFLPGGNLPGFEAPEENSSQKQIQSRVTSAKKLYPEALKLEFQKDTKGNYVVGDNGLGKPVVKEYDLANSPLAAAAGKGLKGDARKEAFEKALGDKLAAEGQKALKNPAIEAGRKWYSTARTRLKGLFGDDTKLFTELLAATSPRTGVEINYKFALDAYNQFKKGAFDESIRKYREGKEKWDRGDISDYQEATGNQNPTRAQFLDWWIETNDISPVQSNGKKFGMNSRSVLRVLDGSWAETVSGPKTPNFAGNLAGTTFEATIDIWAARALHRLAHEGSGKPWRILPANETGVSDADFYIGQAAYRHAAQKLGMKPDALQAVLWFAEKDYWDKRGWTGAQGAEKSDFNSLLKKTNPDESGALKLNSTQSDLFSSIKKK